MQAPMTPTGRSSQPEEIVSQRRTVSSSVRWIAQLVCVVGLLMPLGSTALAGGSNGVDKVSSVSMTPKQDMYFRFLKGEGYSPALDKDGDIVFKKEGRTYILFSSEDDPQFFRLVFPGFWEIENPEEGLRVQAAAGAANNKAKVAKITVVGKNTWGSIELFFDKPEQFKPVFTRSMSALTNAVDVFVKEMRASSPKK